MFAPVNAFNAMKHIAQEEGIAIDFAFFPELNPDGLLLYYTTDDFNFVDPRFESFNIGGMSANMNGAGHNTKLNDKYGVMDVNSIRYQDYIEEWSGDSNKVIQQLPNEIIDATNEAVEKAMLLAMEYLYREYRLRAKEVFWSKVVNREWQLMNSSFPDELFSAWNTGGLL